ncbi:PREDICTED: uncharacterized protein LOC105367891 [Ceratosolen solmsi marchali]|uniref:Uncharacterized protein LOC105367891 n=1 Tax=Ceratosolen solmsi marchali TaxID=326594 RepID=A0AAJ6YVC3_9HYME|nr:PREDICTED: uncharacterized protein LOC105367891 [Ceratosolen solmsi marchali]
MTVQQAMELEPNWLFLNGQLKTIDEIRNSKMNNNLLSIHGNNLPTFSDQNNKNCKCIVLLAGRQQFQNSAIIQKYLGPILPISKDLSCICKSNPYVQSSF